MRFFYVLKNRDGTYVTHEYHYGDIYQMPGYVVGRTERLMDARWFSDWQSANGFADRNQLLGCKPVKIQTEAKEVEEQENRPSIPRRK